MTQLGNVRIFIPNGTAVYGIVLCDKKQKPIAGAQIQLTEAQHGDWLQVEFADPKKALEEEAKERPRHDLAGGV